MKKLLSTLCLSAIMLSTSVAFSQDTIETHEITASVPELVAFHTIIAPMWHNAYPDKDMSALKEFVPQIKEHMVKMNSAKLPGILREKAEAWESELKKFNKVADSYYAAASANDDAALMLAAEKLHSAYEAMNRIVRPFNKEVDEFHKTLYVIYHKHLPEKDFDAISSMMDVLIRQADAITKYPKDELNKRLKDKTPKYYSISKDLYTATIALEKTLSGNNASEKEAAVEKMHTTYQKLETVFE